MPKPYYSDEFVTIFLGDSREIVPTLGRCDLVLTDPNYGIGADANAHKNGEKCRKNYFRQHVKTDWDATRTDADLMRMVLALGDEAIVWGGNYFSDVLPPSQGWIVWDKGLRDFSFADAELAWTSYDRATRIVTVSRAQKYINDGVAQHPTQKSLDVMSYCLSYAERAGGKPIKTVVDPFAGAGTSGRACKDRGIKCVLVEQFENYAEIAAQRMSQASLLFPATAPETEADTLFKLL